MNIFIDEVGYLPNSHKCATTLMGGEFAVINTDTNEEVFRGSAHHFGLDKTSSDDCYIFDFTSVKEIGRYVICADDGSRSDAFSISNSVYDSLLFDLIKCLHYQRCGCGLEEKHVGKYSRPCCHNKPSMFLEDYLSKKRDPQLIDMTGGWHDAGDFGKYVSPAGVTVGHILYAFELFKGVMSIDLNIPESGTGIPDVLSEVRYELDWMLKMQRVDGGVYHKITGLRHPSFLMPEDDHDQMLIFPVSSLATADFAAAMAVASRVYRPYDEKFADKALASAKKAFGWLMENEFVPFKNPSESNTGEYADDCDADERMWAAAELLRTDVNGDIDIYNSVLRQYVFSEIEKTDFGWTDVSGFALLSVLTDSDCKADSDVVSSLYKVLFEKADELVELSKSAGYEIAMDTKDFVWGSNMVVANRGMLFELAVWLLKNRAEAKAYAKNSTYVYQSAAENHIHYLLGRNALGRSYVTGFGEHAYKNPHNRVSACDGIEEAMPGWVSGGPFKNFVDRDALELLPKNTPPQKCHADVVGSYSTNEITIYWNSPMAFLVAGAISNL